MLGIKLSSAKHYAMSGRWLFAKGIESQVVSPNDDEAEDGFSQKGIES